MGKVVAVCSRGRRCIDLDFQGNKKCEGHAGGDGIRWNKDAKVVAVVVAATRHDWKHAKDTSSDKLGSRLLIPANELFLQSQLSHKLLRRVMVLWLGESLIFALTFHTIYAYS